jgi:DNA-binding CsgD family transcriptional regulator
VGSATSGADDRLPVVIVEIEDADLRSQVLQQLERAGGPLRSTRGRGRRVRVCDVSRLTPIRASDRGDLFVVIVPGQDRVAARRALAASAAGIVFTQDLAALAATVRAVAAGQLVVPSALRSAIAKPILTTREKQILAMVVIGLSNREIADQLVLAESTVKSHLFSAFRRLGVRTRREATALILDRDQGLGSGILTITQ